VLPVVLEEEGVPPEDAAVSRRVEEVAGEAVVVSQVGAVDSVQDEAEGHLEHEHGSRGYCMICRLNLSGVPVFKCTRRYCSLLCSIAASGNMVTAARVTILVKIYCCSLILIITFHLRYAPLSATWRYRKRIYSEWDNYLQTRPGFE